MRRVPAPNGHDTSISTKQPPSLLLGYYFHQYVLIFMPLGPSHLNLVHATAHDHYMTLYTGNQPEQNSPPSRSTTC